mmetsp:Transcript_62618/g.123769  ORF Transcript_62618/g.123769 Transcript_62618/m.123769 type:complete len:102 (+) Transcript_62618:1473-1778(+)
MALGSADDWWHPCRYPCHGVSRGSCTCLKQYCRDTKPTQLRAAQGLTSSGSGAMAAFAFAISMVLLVVFLHLCEHIMFHQLFARVAANARKLCSCVSKMPI